MFELVERGNSQEYTPIKQVVLNALDVIEKASKTKGTVTGIPTGFIDLDYKLSGLQRSDLILIAARPSMGKTAFVLNIAQHVAFRQNLAVAIFSLEMSKEQLVNRLFSLESHVDAQVLRTGNLTDTDWEKLIEGAGTIGNSSMIIDDTSGISIAEMRSKCRKYKLELGLDLIIIDYLQLMTGSGGRKNESRQQEISEISRSLQGTGQRAERPGDRSCHSSAVRWSRERTRDRCSRTSESPERSSRMPMCVCSFTGMIIIIRIRKIRILRRSSSQNRETARSARCRLAWMPQYTRFRKRTAAAGFIASACADAFSVLWQERADIYVNIFFNLPIGLPFTVSRRDACCWRIRQSSLRKCSSS